MQYLWNKIKKIDAWIGQTATNFYGSGEAEEIADEPREPLWKENTYIDQPTDKPKAEAAIKSIYKRAELEAPMIIWTQSPVANVFAKASIDYLSNEDLTIPWSFKYGDQFDENNTVSIIAWANNPRGLSVDNDDIRRRAWQSVCEAGWKVGDMGTGPEAWNNVRLYEVRKDICWNHIAPSQVYGESNGLRGFSLDNAWYSIGDIVAARSDNDWLVDLLMQYDFCKRHPVSDVSACVSDLGLG